MASLLRSHFFLLCLLAALLPLVTAQYGQAGSSNGGQPSSGSSAGSSGGSYDYTKTAAYKKQAAIATAHAVLGTLAWALFAPLGAIVLRLNVPGVNLLRLHISTLLLVETMMVVCASLGIWLARDLSKYTNVWTNSHVIIGLVIFCLAVFQPLLGQIHHLVFKTRLDKFKRGVATKRPGRTAVTLAHIWIGRILILLGVINGGLGIRLSSQSPGQPDSTRKVGIVYGVLAGLTFLLFAGISVLFEYRRAARLRGATEHAVPKAPPLTSQPMRQRQKQNEQRQAVR